MKNDKSRWTQYFRVFVDFFNYWIANFLHNELVNIDWFSFHLFAVLRQRASVSSQRQKTLIHSISFHINYDCECWRSGGGGNGAGIFRGFCGYPLPHGLLPPPREFHSASPTPPHASNTPPRLLTFGDYGVGGTSLFQPLRHAGGSFNGFASGMKNSMPYSAHAQCDLDAALVVYMICM